MHIKRVRVSYRELSDPVLSLLTAKVIRVQVEARGEKPYYNNNRFNLHSAVQNTRGCFTKETIKTKTHKGGRGQEVGIN